VVGAVPADLVARIRGNTDTELLFILFLSYLRPPFERRFDSGELVDAFRRVILQTEEWWRSDGEDRLLALNLCVTDGWTVVASRFARAAAEIPSLHWCLGARYVFADGGCHITRTEGEPGCAVIASERLSDDVHWESVPPDHLIVVRNGLQVLVENVRRREAAIF
jgi:predicted glutamine amidotransferase